jgi:Fe-S oxidoreductase
VPLPRDKALIIAGRYGCPELQSLAAAAAGVVRTLGTLPQSQRCCGLALEPTWFYERTLYMENKLVIILKK